MTRTIVTAIRNGDIQPPDYPLDVAAQLHTTRQMLAAAQEQARETEQERAWLAAENATLTRALVGLAEDGLDMAGDLDRLARENAAQASIIWRLNHTNDELRLQMRLAARAGFVLALTDRGGDGYCADGGEG